MSSNHPSAEFEEPDNLGTKAPDPEEQVNLDDDRDPFEEIASEFVERFRKGEFPSIEEYATAHPELAEEIRDLFPTMAAMEGAKAQKSPPPKQVTETLPVEQLGDFRLLGEIGRGGMGIVYEAEQVSLGRHVAVKVLPKQALLDERHLRRFEREAQTAAKLHHTNIVPVFGVGQQDGYNYIVMQFIAGVGLDEVLLALRKNVIDSTIDFPNDNTSRASHANFNASALLKGDFGDSPIANIRSSFVRDRSASIDQTVVTDRRTTAGAVDMGTEAFSVDELSSSSNDIGKSEVDETVSLAKLSPEFYQSVARIGQQVADALAYAHEQGTLHRDIKPGNLLLDGTGTVWVADFGLAKLTEQDNVSRTGDIVGTLSYIPPESFSGETDARGDIYSLGLSLFELLTLRPAFYGRDRGKLVREITEGKLQRLGKLNPSIPRDLETIVLKAVAHRPEDRYATSREMAEDLDCYLNDLPIKARRMSIPEQFTRWYRKNKLVAGLSAAVLSLLILLTITFGVLNYRASRGWEQATKNANFAEAQTKISTEQKEIAQRQTAKANKASIEAEQNAEEAYRVILSTIRSLAPNRLPVTADASALTDSFVGPLADETELDPDADPENVDADGFASSPVVAAIPPTSEKAALLEVLVKSLEDFAPKAGKDSSLATFADLALSMGTLHKTLGNSDEAKASFDDAISRYESLVADSNEIAHVIGLAVCLNEKGDLVRQSDSEESSQLFAQAQELLRRDDLAGSPRAQYELARTLFLMSTKRSGRQRWRKNEQNLIAATKVLEPLLESEPNPEYRYLLARCYTGLSRVTRPGQGESYSELAVAELSKLVEEQPEVADYKFEFAIAKLRRADQLVDPTERLKTTEEAVNLLEEICSSSPGVSNYQVVRSQALGTYTRWLDRRATQLETENENDPVAIWRGRQATEIALRTSEALNDLKASFPAEALSDLDEHIEVHAAEVIAKADEDFAIPLFRQIIEREKDPMILARARLGLGRSLKRSFYQIAEARIVLEDLHADLLSEFEKQSERERLDPRRFFEPFQLLCRAEFELDGLDVMESRINETRAFLTEKGHDVTNPEKVETAGFDLHVADIYTQVGEYDKAKAFRERSGLFLEKSISESTNPFLRRFAAMLLGRLYDVRGDVEALKKLKEQWRIHPPRGNRPERK